MYQTQIKKFRNDILHTSPFVGCRVEGEFMGFSWLGCVMLPETVNQGRHHLFVDLFIDGINYRSPEEYFLVVNEDLQWVPFEKPKDEVGAHIPLWRQHNAVYLRSRDKSLYSNTLVGLDVNAQVYGHTSYYAILTNTLNMPGNPPDKYEELLHLMNVMNTNLNTTSRTFDKIVQLVNSLKNQS